MDVASDILASSDGQSGVSATWKAQQVAGDGHHVRGGPGQGVQSAHHQGDDSEHGYDKPKENSSSNVAGIGHKTFKRRTIPHGLVQTRIIGFMTAFPNLRGEGGSSKRPHLT